MHTNQGAVTPRQPEGEGLEVVAHLEGDEAVVRPHRVYADACRKYDCARRANGAEPLVRLSDAQRAIAKEREHYTFATEKLFAAEAQLDKLAGLLRDALKLGELDRVLSLRTRVMAALTEIQNAAPLTISTADIQSPPNKD